MTKKAVLVTDENGRKYLAKLGQGMVPVRGLGTVDGSLLEKSLESGELSIGGRKFSVRFATVNDILTMIERGAQTLTSKDISVMIHNSGIASGSRAVEVGAGSGALSIALLAAVGEKGTVTTYELREDFASIARKNVEMAGLSSGWKLKIGNACEGIDEKDVDAVLIDIPNPWDCVEPAKGALRLGGIFSAFVPNTNQVETTVQTLRKNGFSEVRTLETMQREIVVHEGGVRPSFDMLGHTGYLVFARK